MNKKIQKISVVISLLLFLTAHYAIGADASPSFESFKVESDSYKKASKINLKTKDAKRFRTVLKREFAVNGDFNEKGTEVGTHYFEWDGSELKQLKSIAN